VKLALIAFAILLLAPFAGADDNGRPVEDIGSIMVAFGAHLDSHPMVGAEDLYKFLHQAVYGPGHAIANPEDAKAWLERELESLGPPRPGEASCEDLGGAPPLARVNLRPFVAGRGNPDLLLHAFVASADRDRGNQHRMETVLSLAASYVQCAGRGELAPELQRLSAELAAQGYPPIHHSEAYVEAYHPAYRVVGKALATEHGWCGETLKRSNVKTLER
jgi:hypothetical protein